MSLLDKAREVKEKERARLEQARKDIPPQYHKFLMDLEQKQRIWSGPAEITPELKALGCYTADWRGKPCVFMAVRAPYMPVDGRIQMMVDEHHAKGEKFSIHTEVVEVGGKPAIRATVETCRGKATAHARIPEAEGASPEATNPVEVTETSAIGRALGFLGYGLLGTGIASYEEVQVATERRNGNEEPAVTAEEHAGVPEEEVASEPAGPADFKLPLGKYKGLTLAEVYDRDPSYVEFLANKIERKDVRENARAFLEQLAEVEDVA